MPYPFERKASLYARCRWDYAPAAVQVVIDAAGINAASTVVDLGAGTGILTRHFTSLAGCVYAVEPDAEMLSWAQQALGMLPAFHAIRAVAEETSLPSACAHLVTAGQSIHWFMAEAARNEILRILRPDGWLAVLRNRGSNPELGRAMNQIPMRPSRLPAGEKAAYFFGSGAYQTHTFAFKLQQNWPDFLGALQSAADAPVEDHPLYEGFRKEAAQVFRRFNVDGQVTIEGETELVLGQPLKIP